MSQEIEYSIRFIDISEQDGEFLQGELGSSDTNTSLRVRKNDFKRVFTADIDIKNTDDICKVIPLVKASKVDVFISLFPDSDSDIYDVPDYVVQIISLEGVALTVSFTYIEDYE